MNTVDLTEDRLYHIHTSFLYLVVCAPAGWSEERVKAEANTLAGSPGTSAGEWVITTGDLPKGLESNPCHCGEDANRRHWLLNC